MISKAKALFAKYPIIGEIVRFCLVGGVATLTDFFVMGVTLYLFAPEAYPNFFSVFIGGESSLLANMIGTGTGFLAGLIVNYVLSVAFVFLNKGNSKTARGFIEFSLLSAVGLGLHEAGMYVMNSIFGVNEWIVKIAMTVIVLIYNYVSRKLLIFRKSEKKEEETTLYE